MPACQVSPFSLHYPTPTTPAKRSVLFLHAHGMMTNSNKSLFIFETGYDGGGGGGYDNRGGGGGYGGGQGGGGGYGGDRY
jgi:hypothetical protein